jgi:uncharacterized membrane protein
MNAAHFHLLVNHLPLAGLLFGLIILVGALVANSKPVANAAQLVLVLAALLVFPAYFSGEGAEHGLMDQVQGIEKPLIHEHEEAALVSLILTIIVGVTAAITLFINNRAKTENKVLIYALLIVGTFALASIAQVAKLGGEIRHTEIRAGNSTTTKPETIEDHD